MYSGEMTQGSSPWWLGGRGKGPLRRGLKAGREKECAKDTEPCSSKNSAKNYGLSVTRWTFLVRSVRPRPQVSKRSDRRLACEAWRGRGSGLGGACV